MQNAQRDGTATVQNAETQKISQNPLDSGTATVLNCDHPKRHGNRAKHHNRPAGQEEKTMETMRLIGDKLRDRNYNGITVDRTYYGPEWCRSHGYSITRRVQDESGQQYDIWEKPGYKAAIPVR